MAKFYGKIGYAEQCEISPGVWDEVVTERRYSGDVIRLSRRMQAGANLNDEFSVDNSISIVADPFAYQNFHRMRYIHWLGVLWEISKIDVQRPRLIISLGGVYNGNPTATSVTT